MTYYRDRDSCEHTRPQTGQGPHTDEQQPHIVKTKQNKTKDILLLIEKIQTRPENPNV